MLGICLHKARVWVNSSFAPSFITRQPYVPNFFIYIIHTAPRLNAQRSPFYSERTHPFREQRLGRLNPIDFPGEGEAAARWPKKGSREAAAERRRAPGDRGAKGGPRRSNWFESRGSESRAGKLARAGGGGARPAGGGL